MFLSKKFKTKISLWFTNLSNLEIHLDKTGNNRILCFSTFVPLEVQPWSDGSVGWSTKRLWVRSPVRTYPPVRIKKQKTFIFGAVHRDPDFIGTNILRDFISPQIILMCSQYWTTALFSHLHLPQIHWPWLQVYSDKPSPQPLSGPCDHPALFPPTLILNSSFSYYIQYLVGWQFHCSLAKSFI